LLEKYNQPMPRSRPLLYLLAGLCCFQAFFAPAPLQASIDIVFPAPGYIVNVGTTVAAEVTGGISVTSVEFYYSRDQVNWNLIQGVAPARLFEYAALWNAADLSPGTYFLRAKEIDADSTITFSPPIQVSVNSQPSALATLALTATPFLLLYDGSGSSDIDGTIVSYSWDFGDGSTASGPVVQHMFAGGGGYQVGLTVTDDKAGAATQVLVVALASNGFMKTKPAANCGCKDMDVKATGAVVGPAELKLSGENSKIPVAEERTLGPYNDGTADGQLDLTKATLTIANRFEVIANLVDNSKPQACEEGQRVQQTYTVNATVQKRKQPLVSDPRYDTSKSDTDPFVQKKLGTGECGAGDDNWCDDAYHGGGNARGAGDDDKQPTHKFKRYDVANKQILWVDSPGIHGAPNDVIKDKTHNLQYKLEAKIVGNLGSCSCSWDVTISIDNKGKVTGNALTNKKCGR
jgi:hypothetical protein